MGPECVLFAFVAVWINSDGFAVRDCEGSLDVNFDSLLVGVDFDDEVVLTGWQVLTKFILVDNRNVRIGNIDTAIIRLRVCGELFGAILCLGRILPSLVRREDIGNGFF